MPTGRRSVEFDRPRKSVRVELDDAVESLGAPTYVGRSCRKRRKAHQSELMMVVSDSGLLLVGDPCTVLPIRY